MSINNDTAIRMDTLPSSIPNLAELEIKPRAELSDRRVKDGIYCLNDVEDLTLCVSKLVILRKAFTASLAAVVAIFGFMSDESKVPKTPNPMNPATFLLRKQCTFGAAYSFGQQSTAIPGPSENWPVAVQRALFMARLFALQMGYSPEAYNGVHANLYDGPEAAVQAHADKEAEMMRGYPIISMTLLDGRKMPRDFQIYEWDGKTKVAEITLDDGDVLIMAGRMQEQFKHAVDKVKTRKSPDPQPCAPRDYRGARRINFTVRAFRPEELVFEPNSQKKARRVGPMV